MNRTGLKVSEGISQPDDFFVNIFQSKFLVIQEVLHALSFALCSLINNRTLYILFKIWKKVVL